MLLEECFDNAAEVYRGKETRIYRAVERSHGTRVLIKCMADEFPSQAQRARMEREYVLLRKLAGPGIPTAQRIEAHGHARRIVFADDGLEALDRLPTPLALDSFFACARALIQTLARVHAAQVLHKDVTPANVVMHPLRAQVQLIDFGLAAELPREVHVANRPGLLEGTLKYMAPEQTGRMNRGVDYRADYYGLGATLFFAATGRPPFVSEDALELVHSHIAREPPLACDCNKGVPRNLSAVLNKLLAKTPEERYQSSVGLLADIEHCAADWARGVDELFVLGSADHSEQFAVSQVLYGREEQVAQLLAAFQRAAAGKTEVLLLPGAPGIGKSALISEVQRPMLACRGLYAAGKFDQFNRGIPFAAVLQAFRGLLRQILTEEESVLRGYREALDAALGANLPVLGDVLPELTLITGPRPPAPALPPGEMQHRFERCVANLVHVLATADHPLVLVLDDLQWADVPSLQLLVQICARSGDGHLLVLGAYRDGEVVGATHPLQIARRDLAKRGIAVTELPVGPLSAAHVQHLVAATLRVPPGEAEEFASVLCARTAGNPFFVTQYLHRLHRDGAIAFDATLRHFRVSAQAMQHMPASDNVADLMSSGLTQLSTETQRVLRLAACIGAEFDLATLSSVCGLSRAATAHALWPALVDGLLLPLSGAYRTVTDGDNTTVRYRFAHDRIQQAAYALLREEETAPTHHAIGQRLHSELSAEEREERLFEIVAHMNKGAQERKDAAAREALADLNLRAAQRAMTAAAFAPAWELLQTALTLRGPDRFARNYQAALLLNTVAAEGAAYAGDLAAMEALVAEVEREGRTLLDKARAREVMMRAYIAKERGTDALRLGRKHLRELGERIPEKLTPVVLLVELVRFNRVLGRRTAEELLQLPPMSDPIKQAAMRTYGLLTAYAYETQPLLTLPLGHRQMALTVRYGMSPAAPVAIGGYASFLCGRRRNMELGLQLSRATVKMAERPESAPFRCRVWIYWAWFCESWVRPGLESSDLALQVWNMSLDAGDLETALTAACMRVLYSFWGNRPLQTILDEARSMRQQWERSAGQAWSPLAALVEQVAANLHAPCPDVAHLCGEFLNQDELLARPTDDRRIVPSLGLHRATLLYIDNRIDEAHAELHASRAILKTVPLCWVPTLWHTQRALVDAVRLPQMSLRNRWRARKRIEQSLRALQTLSSYNSSMCDHRIALLQAEYAAGLERDSEAMDAFDRAISAAHKSKLPGEQAIACERAACFYTSRGRRSVALAYLRDASRAWSAWGAHGRVHALQQRNPEILDVATGASVSVAQSNQGVSDKVLSQAFDASAVIQAAQAIADETDVPSLLSRVMGQALEHAGARRGTLILQVAGEPRVQATVDVADGGALRMMDLALRDSSSPEDGWPAALGRFALRTQETVVLDDAQAPNSAFAGDAWVRARRARSLLALPLTRQGRVLGVLLLDNSLTPAAFTAERLHAVRVIATQAAIALDNALLQRALSTSLKEQTALARANQRFVPAEFLAALDRPSITTVQLGDSVQKELTILFSDMRGFTSHVEGNTPEQNIHFINDYLAAMEPAILRHGGFVDSYIGDAIMALFAVGADAALRASVDMLRNLDEYNGVRARSGLRPIRIGIGLNTGTVTLGTIGGPQRIKCGVIGDAVNLGARVESLSKSYGVSLILSDHTVHRLQNPGAFLLRELDRVRVVGRQAAVTLYESFDADPAPLRDRKQGAAEAWTAALRAYDARDFAGALSHFDACAGLLHDDVTWAKRRARCEQHLRQPPGADWSGIEELHQK